VIPSRPVYLVGIGTTELRREQNREDVAMVVEATRGALADAGIDPGRLTGLNVQSHHAPGPDVAAVVRELGADQVIWAPPGGIGVPGLTAAATALLERRADVSVVCKVMNTATALNQPTIDAQTRRVRGRDQYELPYGLGYTVQRAALAQRRWMLSRKVGPEQLATLCSVQREHAMLNDNAIFRVPLTVEDYLASRMICDPIRLFDCDMPVNGAYAYVLTTEPELMTPGRAVRLAGWTAGDADDMPHIRAEGEPGARPDVLQLYSELGITPDRFCAFMLYDGFSYLAAQWLERLGIVEPPALGEYLADPAHLRFDGPTPLNTHGGQLSEGRMHGAGHLIEAVRQLRGEAGPRQVPDPRLAVVTTAFPPNGAAAILEATR
jgi:acetyl-CoA acetyltransferase